MSELRLERPGALVLGVGGVLGEAWMSGVLAGIASAAGTDFREVELVVGTSAGSIVAAYLVAGEPLRSPHDAADEGLPVPPGVSGSSPRTALLRRAAALGQIGRAHV